MTLFRNRQLAFYISSIGLVLVVGALLWVAYHEWQKKREPLHLQISESPFGPPPGTQLLRGRDPEPNAWWREEPQFTRNLMEKTFTALESGDTSTTKGLLLELERIYPNEPATLWLRANWLKKTRFPSQNQNDLQHIEHKIDSALDKDPTHPLLLLEKGYIQWQKGELQRAGEQWTLAKEISPQFYEPWLALGRWYRIQEKFGQAIIHLKMAHGLKPEKATTTLGELALTFYKAGQTDSTRKLLIYTQKHKLQSDTLKWIEALLLERNGHLDQAEIILKDLIQKNPNQEQYAQSLHDLGMKPVMEEWVQALADSQKFWEKAPAAIQILDPLVRSYPTNAPLWLALGQTYLHYGLKHHAQTALDTALMLDSTLILAKQLVDSLLKSSLTTTHQLKNPEGSTFSEPTPPNPSLHNPTLPTPSFSSPTEQTRNGIEGRESWSNQKNRVFLGHYLVHWDSFREDVLKRYGSQGLEDWKEGLLKQSFTSGVLKHDYILGFDEEKLWGIAVFLRDTSQKEGQLLNKILRQNYSYSGQGIETGKLRCGKFREFNGVLWETEDTIELMGQFAGAASQVRMIRLNRDLFKSDPTTCQLVAYLDTDKWGKPF